MSLHTDTPAKPSRRRKIGAIAALGFLAAGAAGTSALFTDQEQITDNVFVAGTFDLTAEQVGTKINIADMSPGDVASFDVTVGNGGSLDLRYASTGSFAAVGATNLGKALSLKVTDAADTVLYNGTVGGTVTADGALTGSKATGAQAGDRVLAPGATETLTYEVTYSEGADNTFAGAGAELTVDYFAEQTVNNP